MFDAHYDDPRLTALYDLDSPWSVDREFYLSLARESKQKILDLGCGTGLLCNAYAEKGHIVTGLDPSTEMLKIARQKSHGKDIEWIHSTAQDYKSDDLFDLIIMTGHAFQTLHSDVDVDATYSMMRNQLKPQGRVVFESRNPKIDWSSRWDYEMEIQLPSMKIIETRKFIEFNNDYMTFDLLYKFPEQALISKSRLRFLSKDQIEQGLNKAGLCVERLSGDWDGRAFDPEASQEMIFMARKT